MISPEIKRLFEPKSREVFNPVNEMKFDDFLKMLNEHCLTSHLFMAINGDITRFIIDMHNVGLDTEMDVEFHKTSRTLKRGDTFPVILMYFKAKEELKKVFALQLSKCEVSVTGYKVMTPEEAAEFIRGKASQQ